MTAMMMIATPTILVEFVYALINSPKLSNKKHLKLRKYINYSNSLNNYVLLTIPSVPSAKTEK